ncbi:DUF4296 domain-containing protein [Aquimarina sp. D1M17]|uniref:DUF4296 domain-containing protein n=1 Tax=Aquimarina acroporae TaxID=2937283 RepID=UPI0020BD9F36|nr:DUF4296 domain-containing protein [Aquimarina acroporae]MCK8520886.1 DUF4296 domain-containing protein [Aquimarina acroporae]
MILRVLFCFVLVLVFSCQSIEKFSKPEVVLEEDLMVEILTEIAFIKAAKASSRKVFEEKMINPESYILKKYDIDSIVFAENNLWYSGQLERYEKIFKRVKANVDSSKVRFEKIKKKEDSIKRIEDSIKKAKDTLDVKDKLVPSQEEMEKEIEKARNKRFKNSSEEE